MSKDKPATNRPTYVAELKPQHLRQLPELDRIRTLGIIAAIVFARRDADRGTETYAKDLGAAVDTAIDLLYTVEQKESFYVVAVDESDVAEAQPQTREQLDEQLANRMP
jgi:hypothetical protein